MAWLLLVPPAFLAGMLAGCRLTAWHYVRHAPVLLPVRLQERVSAAPGDPDDWFSSP